MRCALFYSLNTKAVRRRSCAAPNYDCRQVSRKPTVPGLQNRKRRQKPTVRTPPICRPPIEHQWKETSGQPSRGQAARRCTSPPGPEGPGAAWAWVRGRRGGAMIPAAPPHGGRLARIVSAGASPLAACEASGQASKGRRLAGALGGARSLGTRPEALLHPWELHGTSRLATRALTAAVARESIWSLEGIS